MRKSRFTEAQIIGMIKEQEAGLLTAELCRKHGLSPATFYKLKAKYGGMDLSDAKRLKQLEDENAKLKRLVADVVVPPFLTGCTCRTYAAIFSFCAGVMPPMPMLGRSLL